MAILLGRLWRGVDVARTQPALMAMMDRLRARHDVSGLQVQQIRGENPIQFSIIYQWEAQNDR